MNSFPLPYYISQHGLRGRHPESVLMRAINLNPLSFFLLANLLTGLVNFVFPTLLMDGLSAMIVLVAYLAVLTLFAFITSEYNVRLA